MAFIGNGAQLTDLDAGDITSGTIATARLGSGTANSTTFLRGDQTYAAVAGAPNPLHGSQVFTSNGTFTVPSGVTAVKLTVIGAGGNGGNGVGDWYSGAGGGGGGCIITYASVTPGGTISMTIGTNGGTRTTTAAVSGGSTFTAAGGTNGANAVYGQPQPIAGLSGAATIFGQTYYLAGCSRITNGGGNANSLFYTSSPGSNSVGQIYAHGYGLSGDSRTSSSNSLNRHNAIGFGGGGGGGSTESSYQGGGTGANGVVAVEW
jgi:hypothetical protein